MAENTQEEWPIVPSNDMIQIRGMETVQTQPIKCDQQTRLITTHTIMIENNLINSKGKGLKSLKHTQNEYENHYSSSLFSNEKININNKLLITLKTKNGTRNTPNPIPNLNQAHELMGKEDCEVFLFGCQV